MSKSTLKKVTLVNVKGAIKFDNKNCKVTSEKITCMYYQSIYPITKILPSVIITEYNIVYIHFKKKNNTVKIKLLQK